MSESLSSHVKTCKQCEETKPFGEFGTVKRKGQLKYRSICKACDSAASALRYQRRKSRAGKVCAYPSCESIISPQSTYCPAHVYVSSEFIARIEAKTLPRPQCAHPDCNVVLSSHRHKYCRFHFNTRERSLETRTKMSNSAKARANTVEGRARLSYAAKILNGMAWQGRHHTEETKAKLREKRLQQIIPRERMEIAWSKLRGRSSKRKGIPLSDDVKTKISMTLQSKREYLSRKGKERYARETEQQRIQRVQAWIKAGQDAIAHIIKDTSIEIFVAQSFDALCIPYETQKVIGCYTVDFLLPERKLIVEVNGCYWHGCEQCGYATTWHMKKRGSDQRRTEYLARKGYQVKVIWEHHVRHMMQRAEHDWMIL